MDDYVTLVTIPRLLFGWQSLDGKVPALWLRRKHYQGKRVRFEKWFRFRPWSTQRKTGRLSPYAMMGHSGFIMAHGHELRMYPKTTDL